MKKPTAKGNNTNAIDVGIGMLQATRVQHAPSARVHDSKNTGLHPTVPHESPLPSALRTLIEGGDDRISRELPRDKNKGRPQRRETRRQEVQERLTSGRIVGWMAVVIGPLAWFFLTLGTLPIMAADGFTSTTQSGYPLSYPSARVIGPLTPPREPYGGPGTRRLAVIDTPHTPYSGLGPSRPAPPAGLQSERAGEPVVEPVVGQFESDTEGTSVPRAVSIGGIVARSHKRANRTISPESSQLGSGWRGCTSSPCASQNNRIVSGWSQQ